MKLVHWPLIGGCYIWYSEEGTGWGRSPPRPLLAVPNVTAHPSTASVPITVLLCGFNVPVKGLSIVHRRSDVNRALHADSNDGSDVFLSGANSQGVIAA